MQQKVFHDDNSRQIELHRGFKSCLWTPCEETLQRVIPEVQSQQPCMEGDLWKAIVELTAHVLREMPLHLC